MTKNEVIALLQRYEDQLCTPEERVFLQNWYLDQSKKNASLTLSENFLIDKEASLRLILYPRARHRISTLKRSVYLYKKYSRIVNTALFIICLSVSFLLYRSMGGDGRAVVPGGYRAMLTLPEGGTINLVDAGNGVIATDGAMKIRKVNNELLFEIIDSQKIYRERGQGEYKIETPNGGQYAVVLPDHSKVWLNAGSTISFPVDFTAADRRLQLNGEAYFEVFKDKLHAFRVRTKMQNVEVLGTHFNISSYADEAVTKTTLLQGTVQVVPLTSASGHAPTENLRVLAPNEEAVLTPNAFYVKKVDPADAIAWKDGLFTFTDQPLEEVMAEIGRWYDVNISYGDGQLKEEKFTASFSKYTSMTTVLKILESTGAVYGENGDVPVKKEDIHFRMEGRELKVYR
ncbi:FecR family protein [Pedobacter sp. AW31-3R]|uniref:FecR family protein n=1 Tax=Pedobacter sp. AW31-3R TaxID=3445781 RepID=UPI003FA0B801